MQNKIKIGLGTAQCSGNMNMYYLLHILTDAHYDTYTYMWWSGVSIVATQGNVCPVLFPCTIHMPVRTMFIGAILLSLKSCLKQVLAFERQMVFLQNVFGVSFGFEPSS